MRLRAFAGLLCRRPNPCSFASQWGCGSTTAGALEFCPLAFSDVDLVTHILSDLAYIPVFSSNRQCAPCLRVVLRMCEYMVYQKLRFGHKSCGTNTVRPSCLCVSVCIRDCF